MQYFFPESTHVSFLGYTKEDEVMVVFFQTGAVYSYEDVSHEQWREIIGARSIGSKLNAFFRGNPGIKAPSYKEVIGLVEAIKDDVNEALSDSSNEAANYYTEG